MTHARGPNATRLTVTRPAPVATMSVRDLGAAFIRARYPFAVSTVFRSRRLVLLTVLAPLAWGSSYVVISGVVPPGRPLFTATCRLLPAGVILLAAAGRQTWRRPRGREWAHTIGLSLCNLALFYPLFVVAAYRLAGGVAAAAAGLQPIMVALPPAVLDRRAPRRPTVAVGVQLTS